MYYIKKIDSPVGKLTLVSEEGSLTGLYFDKQKYGFCQNDYMEKDLPVFHQVEKWLHLYFQGNNCQIDFPINLQVTPFRKLVLEKLMEIPYGQTVTYGFLAEEIAKITGKKKCPQAIGQAVGHNPIGIIIPCHRVIGCDGKLTGYAGGIEKKAFLLQLENGNVSH